MSRRVVAGLVGVLMVLLAGCGARVVDSDDGGVAPEAPTAAAAAPVPASTSLATDVRSIALSGNPLSADVLVRAQRTISSQLAARVSAARGVRLAVPLALASIPVADQEITVAAVDPARFRRFTPPRTARMEAVWRSVVRGDLLLGHDVARRLRKPLGDTLVVGLARSEAPLRVGALASTVSGVDAVVNGRRGDQLGMPRRNAMVVSLDHVAADQAVAAIRHILGDRAHVQLLETARRMTQTEPRGFLKGGALARAVGSFSYRAFADGSVAPDPEWVAANIRTESVPILGRVTCHRVALPQLRGALDEVVERDLSTSIDSGDYGGCYVPRFIGHDPQRGLSLHTWGIALDLNVSGNQRGTVGEVDREIVAIFKRWGFAWGGDWQWTDPMHFELAVLVRPGVGP